MRILLILLIFTACSAKSGDYFLAQGRFINLQIIDELQRVHDLDTLVEVLPALEMQFKRLVDLMIEAKKWQVKHKTTWKPTREDEEVSRQLADELLRVYEIPTARILIEKCQEQALLALDTFQKRKN